MLLVVVDVLLLAFVDDEVVDVVVDVDVVAGVFVIAFSMALSA